MLDSCRGLSLQGKSCLGRYISFNKKPVIEMTLAEGYMDGELPTDGIWSASDLDTVTSRLLAPCQSNSLACGFRQDPRDMEYFTKTIVGFNNQRKLVRIHVVSGALSADPKYNALHAKEQAALSARVQKIFLDAVAQGQEAVFYNGHARDGGGPDFSPGRFKNGKLNYAWYSSERAHGRGGEVLLEKAMRKASASGHPPSFFGDFSCASRAHFEKSLEKVSPNTSLILSSWLTNGLATTSGILTSIDMMLKEKCGDEFNAELRKNTRSIVTDEGRAKESEFDLYDFR